MTEKQSNNIKLEIHQQHLNVTPRHSAGDDVEDEDLHDCRRRQALLDARTSILDFLDTP